MVFSLQMQQYQPMSVRAHVFQRACRARVVRPELRQNRRKLKLLQELQRHASNKTTGASRRAITVTSDDGRYAWSELSTGEKAARTTQQSFNFLLVAAGTIGTVAVIYLLYKELFAIDSKTRQFNRAVDRVKADPRCRALLGPAKEIKAYGEPTSNKWARARPLAHSVNVDQYGVTHLKMHFNVEGPDGMGQVQVHMTKTQEQNEPEYKLLSLTVPGNQTVYLENAEAKTGKKNLTRMFGVQWGR